MHIYIPPFVKQCVYLLTSEQIIQSILFSVVPNTFPKY